MSSAEPVREWVGGRFELPAPVESMGERRAQVTLWVELPGLEIVGQTLEDPQDPQATFGQSLMRAMASPLIGEPRRPARVRVADAALAQQLDSFSFLRVEVAPTPELDKVVRAVGAFFGEESYFSDPALTPGAIEPFFAAASQLWTAQPWTQLSDEALVHVAVPSRNIDDGCIAVVGSLEETYGFVFFPSFEDHERMTAVPIAPHSALYFSFEARDDLSEGMRAEVAKHGWPLADADAYPLLLRMVDGKPAPVFAPDYELATALARALATFVTRHAESLEDYGRELRESYREGAGPELILSVPHPRAFEAYARAQTLSGEVNPYELPLSAEKVRALEKSLGAFTLHRVMGLLCAVASLPQPPPPSFWLGEITQQLKLATPEQARTLVDVLKYVHGHVVEVLEEGEIDSLVPTAEDAEACKAWARGYTTVLKTLDPASIAREPLDAAFAIQTLAEVPSMLQLFEKLHGAENREAALASFRASLADDANVLLEYWSEADAPPLTPVAAAPIRNEAPKVGRNDPCPCGSGKKHKKCCAR